MYEPGKWLNAAADCDHAESYYYLGFTYLRGLGCKENAPAAFEYFARAAELNSLKGTCSLAYMLEHGIGCTCDLHRSYELYRQSASRGHLGAQFALACAAFAHSDYEEALIWLHAAAEHGLAEAQAFLARLYMNGLGTKQNVKTALMWCFVVQNNDQADQETLDMVMLCHGTLCQLATQSELDDAYTCANAWINQHNESLARQLFEID